MAKGPRSSRPASFCSSEVVMTMVCPSQMWRRLPAVRRSTTRAACLLEIAMMEPWAISNPGKIYRCGKYLLVNEKQQGIHIFDNTDPAMPVNRGFPQLLGNTDMAIRDSVIASSKFCSSRIYSFSLHCLSRKTEGTGPLTS